MAIGRGPTDDKNEVLASAKISRVVLSKILKLTWRNPVRVASSHRIMSFLCLSVCL